MFNRMTRNKNLTVRILPAVLIPVLLLILAITFAPSAQAQEPTPTPAPESKKDTGSEHVGRGGGGGTPACSVHSIGAITTSATESGTWSSSCLSSRRTGRYARLYSFDITSTSTVAIDLTSAIDTYLYLLEGIAVLEYDDDGGDEGFDSRIVRELGPGTYTIEATTYFAGRAGDFDLEIGVTPSATNPPTPAPTPSATSTTPSSGNVWTATLGSVQRSDEFGYDDSFGTLMGGTFEYDGTSYTIEYLKWDRSEDELLLLLDRCLKRTEFVSLQIGSTPFSNTDLDEVREPDSECNRNREYGQRFEFHDVSDNPLVAGVTYDITITLGTSSTTAPTNSGCVIPLGEVSGYLERDDETWVSSCASVNRENSYAKFYSFTLSQMADVQVDLISTLQRDPYLYLLEGSGTTGAQIASDDDGGPLNRDSRITSRLLPGAYTIEATTYRAGVSGDFEISMTVSPMEAERVASTTVQFGLSLSSPKGLAWDGSQLYMVDDGTDALYTVATSTGVATRVSATTTRFGLSASINPRGLTWDGSTLYMITQSRLYTLDRTTGVANLVGSFGTDISGATGLAWKRSLTATSTGETGKPAPGRLYMVDSGEDALYIVDTATGSATPTDAFAVDSSISEFGDTVRIPRGISWVGSDLYMVSSLPGNTYLLDETTGMVTDLVV